MTFPMFMVTFLLGLFFAYRLIVFLFPIDGGRKGALIGLAIAAIMILGSRIARSDDTPHVVSPLDKNRIEW